MTRKCAKKGCKNDAKYEDPNNVFRVWCLKHIPPNIRLVNLVDRSKSVEQTSLDEK